LNLRKQKNLSTFIFTFSYKNENKFKKIEKRFWPIFSEGVMMFKVHQNRSPSWMLRAFGNKNVRHDARIGIADKKWNRDINRIAAAITIE